MGFDAIFLRLTFIIEPSKCFFSLGLSLTLSLWLWLPLLPPFNCCAPVVCCVFFFFFSFRSFCLLFLSASDNAINLKSLQYVSSSHRSRARLFRLINIKAEWPEWAGILLCAVRICSSKRATEETSKNVNFRDKFMRERERFELAAEKIGHMLCAQLKSDDARSQSFMENCHWRHKTNEFRFDAHFVRAPAWQILNIHSNWEPRTKKSRSTIMNLWEYNFSISNRLICLNSWHSKS